MTGELAATVGEQDHYLTIEPTNGQWRVRIGEREMLVDAQKVKPGTWSLLVDGRSILVDVDLDREPPWFYTYRATTPVAVMSAQRRRLEQKMAASGGAKSRGETIKAPIAGRVVKIQVEVGQRVESGTCVAILEAMKMENEIKCSRDGVVVSIGAAAGDSVDTGAKLLEIRPEEGE